MRADDSVVDVRFGFGEAAFAHQGRELLVVVGEREEVVQISDLAEVGADGVQEHQLQVDITFDQIDTRFSLIAVQDIQVFHA